MADIAFLLLIFFLVATTMQTQQGLSQQLPPDSDRPKSPMQERNLFKVAVNSKNEILCAVRLLFLTTDLEQMRGCLS